MQFAHPLNCGRRGSATYAGRAVRDTTMALTLTFRRGLSGQTKGGERRPKFHCHWLRAGDFIQAKMGHLPGEPAEARARHVLYSWLLLKEAGDMTASQPWQYYYI